MDKEKILNYLDSSFLSSLLKKEEITDISYNGKDIFYVSNIEGRKKSNIVIAQQTARDFVRQIANLCEAQFSFSNPVLDLSVGKYRINAIHQSIGRIKDEGTISFSIRVASTTLRINDDSDFFTPQIVELISILLKRNESIVIGGVTSSGKTEFQKYILSKMINNERIIVIDNVLELDQIRNEYSDLTCWHSDEENQNSTSAALIKNALRNNPDWLILAEARGKEMVDCLNSAMTGIPVITTIHSKDSKSMPYRMGRMMMKSEQKLDYQECLQDIYYHFHYYFYLSKVTVDGHIRRHINEIGYVSNDGTYKKIYSFKNGKSIYDSLPKNEIEYIKNTFSCSNLFSKSFLGVEK